MDRDYKEAPLRAVRFGAADTSVERRVDGSLRLKSPHPLGAFARCVTEPLARWARECPGVSFLAERAPTGAWRHLTYGEAATQVRAIGQALL